MSNSLYHLNFTTCRNPKNCKEGRLPLSSRYAIYEFYLDKVLRRGGFFDLVTIEVHIKEGIYYILKLVS